MLFIDLLRFFGGFSGTYSGEFTMPYSGICGIPNEVGKDLVLLLLPDEWEADRWLLFVKLVILSLFASIWLSLDMELDKNEYFLPFSVLVIVKDVCRSPEVSLVEVICIVLSCVCLTAHNIAIRNNTIHRDTMIAIIIPINSFPESGMI